MDLQAYGILSTALDLQSVNQVCNSQPVRCIFFTSRDTFCFGWHRHIFSHQRSFFVTPGLPRYLAVSRRAPGYNPICQGHCGIAARDGLRTHLSADLWDRSHLRQLGAVAGCLIQAADPRPGVARAVGRLGHCHDSTDRGIADSIRLRLGLRAQPNYGDVLCGVAVTRVRGHRYVTGPLAGQVQVDVHPTLRAVRLHLPLLF